MKILIKFIKSDVISMDGVEKNVTLYKFRRLFNVYKHNYK